MKQILTILLLFTTITLFAQTLYTRTDSIAITSDSVTLQAGAFRGTIQWQRSLDGNIWDNLTGKTDSILQVAKTSEGFYRAKLTDGTCLPTYSDTAVIVANKPANNLITDPDNIAGATFIERDGGTFTFVGSSANIPVNTVFVDSDKESDIRVVTGISRNGDTLSVSTKPGTMEDLFFNQEFKLTTELLDNTNKSAYLTKEALAKAMVDDKGYIHPVRVIDNNAGNLKSVETTNDGSLPTINFKYDFSNTPLWKEDGADISISEGYFQLGAKLDYEFKFESSTFDWKNLSFPKGKITHFKISTDKEQTKAEAKVILTAKTSGEFKDKDTKILKKMLFTKTFEYLIIVPPAPPIPFWATVTVDLMRDASVSISGEASVSGGATAGVNLEVGTSYDNGKWATISPKATPSLVLEGPTVDAKVNIQAKYEVYPHVEVAFYSILAPYLEIGPYMREEMECSLAGNYKYDFWSGADARLGVRAEIFGVDLFDYKTDDLNLYEDTLYTTPNKVQVVSGDNQKGTAGKPLPQPIIIKVLDSKDKPVKNAVVNFKASLGKLFKALLSSPENAELKSAMLFASGGDSTELAVASDTTGQVTINWTLADSTSKHKLEAFLMNGKDSIREDTRDTLTAEVECGCDITKFEYFTDSRDGHVYKTIKIGNQTWMAENLAYLPYTTPTTRWSETSPCYYVYNYVSYGVLYNWHAALTACPAGWHLPSDDEWTTLSNYLGGESVAGGKMKTTTGWNNPNTGATNESCFSALPDGAHLGGGGLCDAGYRGYWWSSAAYGEYGARHRHLSYNFSWLSRPWSSRSSGFSVRCISD